MRQLGVFAKYWQPGAAKTRLASAIGELAAAELARCMLVVTLARFATSAERRVLAFTPAERSAEFAMIAGSWQLDPQCAGDLGTRMQDYFRRAASTGAERVVLLGSDSPHLPSGYIEQAFAALDKVPVVLGPSDDGGYYLIGARGVPRVFDGIPWSTGEVWDRTIERLASESTPYFELPRWYDVDDLCGLQRLGRDLNSGDFGDCDDLRCCVREALAAAGRRATTT